MELTHDIVRELLDYDPETGRLFWKERDVKWFNETETRSKAHSCKIWNNRYAGKECFTTSDKKNYKKGTLLFLTCKAHRIIWLWFHGEWPDQVDHINGDASDNRLINLRNVTQFANQKNAKIRTDNKTGFSGVTQTKHGTIVSRITVNNKLINLGCFESIEDAAIARKAAEIKYGFHPNHGKR